MAATSPDSGRISDKKLKIDKDNSTVLVVLAVASFVIVFSLVSIKDLISQYSYQKRVASVQQTTVSTIKQDQSNAAQLISSYNSFISESPNILDGTNQGGGGSNQENNAQIIIDALPTSEEVSSAMAGVLDVLNTAGVTVSGLSSGSNIAAPTTSASSATGDIPFSFSISGSTPSIENMLNALNLSIRPMQVETLSLTGTDSNLQISVTAQTYFQGPTNVSISTETVK